LDLAPQKTEFYNLRVDLARVYRVYPDFVKGLP
jgi:hypothetical protein